ncbi:TetR/AcrR family transcriptional regulator [Streptomyces cavernicola]|uniref:TetR family transcriptional regulator n=1 Tax=Streptomyces cavernicola TaxID=3043613 RepID=A0ABT6S4W2_9ACTN|nr:TetR family transcriptional regulator [Streptomyces sp. B-S-A6]MDI3403124.1 TetR family transcriptional regulator [Streptomyces sp. B-S-A6]
MSTKPQPPAARTSPSAASLTERRKAATQLEIAHAAAELFTELGPDATTTEAIAARAGVGLRTFYRYFRNKQDAVGPLLAVGGEQWRARLAATDPGTPLPAALHSAVADALTPADEAAADGLRQARGLLRAAAEDPALRAVWYRVNQESEEQLRPVLAALMGPDTDPLRVRLAAATATAAIRIALETWADPERTPDASAPDADVRGPGSPADLAGQCLRALMPE